MLYRNINCHRSLCRFGSTGTSVVPFFLYFSSKFQRKSVEFGVSVVLIITWTCWSTALLLQEMWWHMTWSETENHWVELIFAAALNRPVFVNSPRVCPSLCLSSAASSHQRPAGTQVWAGSPGHSGVLSSCVWAAQARLSAASFKQNPSNVKWEAGESSCWQSGGGCLSFTSPAHLLNNLTSHLYTTL